VGNPLIDILVAVVALIAFVGLAGTLKKSPYDDIGAGKLTFQHDGEDAEAFEIAARLAHDDEIRQMLQARSERLQRLGEPPLDVEAELARINAGGAEGTPD
jgi:hypothetical protein